MSPVAQARDRDKNDRSAQMMGMSIVLAGIASARDVSSFLLLRDSASRTAQRSTVETHPRRLRDCGTPRG
jgi:hypothetical protein